MFEGVELAPVPDAGAEIAAGADHHRLDFSGVDFSGQALMGHNFEDCRFRDCLFSQVSFVNGRLNGCLLEGCALQLAEIGNLALVGTGFVSCKLQGLDFSDCRRLGFSPTFRRSLLDNCAFGKNALKKRALADCDLRACDFMECDLRECDFSGSRFDGVNFNRCNLEKADFRGATGYRIDPVGNRVAGGRYDLPEAQSFLTFFGLKLG